MSNGTDRTECSQVATWVGLRKQMALMCFRGEGRIQEGHFFTALYALYYHFI